MGILGFLFKKSRIKSHAKPSIINDLKLENKCYKLILAKKYDKAYRMLTNENLSKADLINYTDHLKLKQHLPKPLKRFQKQLNACVILGSMAGASYKQIVKLFQRICSTDIDLQMIREAVFMNHSYFYGKRDIISYLEDGVENYQYLAASDSHTCEKCAALNGRVFRVREAEFGVNFPPMCKACRCTTVPFYEEEDAPLKIPPKITYKEWYKQYADKEV